MADHHDLVEFLTIWPINQIYTHILTKEKDPPAKVLVKFMYLLFETRQADKAENLLAHAIRQGVSQDSLAFHMGLSFLYALRTNNLEAFWRIKELLVKYKVIFSFL